mmetsp:Transcript_11609/g.20914  ORF Transcript_11609/g.20914 Transcript_11609/m.20914 type:complete len:132 (-) Transcript_11609:122-517(-)
MGWRIWQWSASCPSRTYRQHSWLQRGCTNLNHSGRGITIGTDGTTQVNKDPLRIILSWDCLAGQSCFGPGTPTVFSLSLGNGTDNVHEDPIVREKANHKHNAQPFCILEPHINQQHNQSFGIQFDGCFIST